MPRFWFANYSYDHGENLKSKTLCSVIARYVKSRLQFCNFAETSLIRLSTFCFVFQKQLNNEKPSYFVAPGDISILGLVYFFQKSQIRKNCSNNPLCKHQRLKSTDNFFYHNTLCFVFSPLNWNRTIRKIQKV